MDTVSKLGKTPLMYAAQYNHLPVIRVLAEHSAHVNYTNTKNEGLTALHYAVINGNEETVTELLNMGSHMSIKCKSAGKTPLYVAAVNGIQPRFQRMLKSKRVRMLSEISEVYDNLPPEVILRENEIVKHAALN
jgi:ankyrin repeat protein